jgi:hypothetical protein
VDEEKVIILLEYLNVACMEEMRKTYIILVGKAERTNPLSSPARELCGKGISK